MKKSYLALLLLPLIALGLAPLSQIEFKDNTFLTTTKKKLGELQAALPQEKVYLHFDKPFYEPGDDIWFKAYVQDGATHRVSSTSEVLYVDLIDPKGNTAKTLKLVALDGTAKGDFHLEEDAAGGLYKIQARTQWMANFGEETYFTKELQVQAVTLPKLRMNLDFEREAYGPGDEVTAKLKLANLENRPLSNYHYRFVSQLDGQTLINGKGQTDEAGLAFVSFELPKGLETNDGLLNVLISYQGTNESISRSVPIVLNKIDLQFFPEGGDLVSEVPGRVGFKALNEFGKPADVEGEVRNKEGKVVAEFRSFHQGMGAFDLTPDQEGYTATITKPEGITETYKLPAAIAKGYGLRVEKVHDEGLEITTHSPLDKPMSLLMHVRGVPVFSTEISEGGGQTTFTVPTSDFPAGIAQVTLFDYKGNERCERLVFVNDHRQMQVKVTSEKEKYLPREEVTLNLEVTDSDGLPVPANLSMAVVDDKLISFADDKSDNILSYLLMTSELKGEIEEPNFYFKKEEEKASQALDYLLMTQGWRRFTWAEITAGNPALWQKQASQAPEKAIIRGRVQRAANDQSVDGIEVQVVETGEHVFTGPDGTFEFEGLDLTHPITLKAMADDGRNRVIQVADYHNEHILRDGIRGIVTDASTGEPIPFANVFFPDAGIGATTNIDGYYRINNIPQGATRLHVNFIGMQSKVIDLNGSSHLDIALNPDPVNLNEVAINAERVRVRNDVQMMAVKANAIQRVPARGQARAKRAERERGARRERKEKEQAKVMAPPPPPAADPVPAPQAVVEDVKDLDAPALAEIPVVEDDMEIAEVEEADEQFEPMQQGRMRAQEEEKKRFEANKNVVRGQEVFAIVEKMPEPEGGMEGMMKYLSNSVKYPQQAIESGVEGKVYVRFIVDESGQVKDPHVVRGMGFGLDEAALEAVRNMPNWTPGEQRGRKAKVAMVVPIQFKDQKALQIELPQTPKVNLRLRPGNFHVGREFYVPKYSPEDQVETRTDFRQTIYWNPDIRVGKNGKTSVTFANSDEITTFRAIVEGMSSEGNPGRQEFTYFTQLPFGMQTKVPAYLTFEDKVSVPLTLKNNTKKSITGKLAVSVPESFSEMGTVPNRVTVPANQAKTIYLDYGVQSIAGKGTLSIRFESAGLSDAFEQEIEVLAKGFPINHSYSSKKLSASYKVAVQDVVQGSMTASVAAYPDMLTEIMSGVESILREPGGCFEQTSRSAYPNVLALAYMNETGTASASVREKAEGMIKRGYNRLVSFETKEKGYEWFGSAPGHEGLTAYGLMEFQDMKEVYASVDDKMVQRTAKWLNARRDGKGGFQRNKRALDSFGRASESVQNAYIVYAMSEAGFSDIDLELNAAHKEAMASKDAYRLACVANAWYNLDVNARGDEALKAALDGARKSGFDQLGAEHSITRSTGQNLQIEANSILIMAMLKAPTTPLKELDQAVTTLTNSRSHGGRFGSTQGTILALKALTEFAKFNKRTADSGILEVYVDGKKVGNRPYAKNQKDEIRVEGLEKFLPAGKHDLKVKFAETKNAMPFSVNLNWNTRTPFSQEDCVVDLQTKLNKKRVKVGETVRLTTVLSNKTDEGQAMSIAVVGIPSGLSAQPWQLKELQKQQKFDFYEIYGQSIVFYYRDLAPSEKHEINLDLKAEVPGTFQAPASSGYLYYTDELKTWVSGETIEINQPQ